MNYRVWLGFAKGGAWGFVAGLVISALIMLVKWGTS